MDRVWWCWLSAWRGGSSPTWPRLTGTEGKGQRVLVDRVLGVLAKCLAAGFEHGPTGNERVLRADVAGGEAVEC